MHKTYNTIFNREIVYIHPGEYFVSRDSQVIATVLGSCISVCFRDERNNIAGMNHFMLPGDYRNENFLTSKSAKYGMYAMELLINKMMKLGGEKRFFQAKVFGGGHVLNFRKTDGNVPQSNIDFTRNFLKMEKIRIIKEDIGGYTGRKIFYFTDSGKVLLKRLKSTAGQKFLQEEERYKIKIFQEREKREDLTLF